MNRPWHVGIVLAASIVVGCSSQQYSVIQADLDEVKEQLKNQSERLRALDARSDIRFGSVQVDRPSTGWDDWSQGKQFRRRVAFDPPYGPGIVPKVIVGLTGMDVQERSRVSLSAEVLPESVSNTGFTLAFSTRGPTSVTSMSVSWLALFR